MATYYVGEIKMFAGSFAPYGWNFCDGSLLSVSTYAPLYAVIGTTYGGNGTTTFALPDLRGRVPLQTSGNFPLGSNGGAETVTLTTAQIPSHTHTPAASSTGGSDSPVGNFW